ncbi:hypothetical protein [Akkermansia sp.]|uniref:hypothetical protein n=2 Tax=Akkermansia sp. TaxID=1872421 RepID=UPI003AF6C6F8
MLEKGPAISWTGCPFGELNCSPLFWQAVSEREKNTERIANPKSTINDKNKMFRKINAQGRFLMRVSFLGILNRCKIPNARFLCIKMVHRISFSDWQSAKG